MQGLTRRLAARRVVLLATTGGLTGLIALCWWCYSRTPGYVMDQAVKALYQQDASRLVSLASRTERRSMGLTPKTVEALLRRTWWRSPRLQGRLRVTGRRTKFADVLAYAISVTGFQKGPALTTELQVYQDRYGRWRLGLSELLYVTPMLCNGMTGDYARAWDKMAAAAGIRGVASADGGTRWNNGTFVPEIVITGH